MWMFRCNLCDRVCSYLGGLSQPFCGGFFLFCFVSERQALCKAMANQYRAGNDCIHFNPGNNSLNIIFWQGCKWSILIFSNYFLKFLAIMLQFYSRGQLDKMCTPLIGFLFYSVLAFKQKSFMNVVFCCTFCYSSWHQIHLFFFLPLWFKLSYAVFYKCFGWREMLTLNSLSFPRGGGDKCC